MNYLESDLEDWAEFNLGPLIHEDAVCLKRQMVLPSGRRLDLLFGHKEEVGGAWVSILTVVEMKKGTPSASAVAQICDYMDEVGGSSHEAIVSGLIVADARPDDEARAILRRLPRVGCVSLRARLECRAWHCLWGTGDHAEANSILEHCSTGVRDRGTEAEVTSLLSGPVSEIEGYHVAKVLGARENAALGPGGD